GADRCEWQCLRRAASPRAVEQGALRAANYDFRQTGKRECDAACWLSDRLTMPDLLVNLLKLREAPEPGSFVLRRAPPSELTPLRTFIEKNFSIAWADEVSVGFSNKPISVYVATID